MAVITKMLIK